MDWGTPSFLRHLWFDGKHIKAGSRQRSNIFQHGRRGSAEPTGSSQAKNAPNPQQGLLQKGVTSICKTSLRCSISYCCEDSKSGGGMRREILPSKVGIHDHEKKNIEQFSFSKQLLCRTRHLAQSSYQQETNQHQQSMKGLTCVQNLAKTQK